MPYSHTHALDFGETARILEKELLAQVRAATMVYAAASADISDQQALKMPDLFQTWEQVPADGQEILKGRVIKKDRQLYRAEPDCDPVGGSSGIGYAAGGSACDP